MEFHIDFLSSPPKSASVWSANVSYFKWKQGVSMSQMLSTQNKYSTITNPIVPIEMWGGCVRNGVHTCLLHRWKGLHVRMVRWQRVWLLIYFFIHSLNSNSCEWNLPIQWWSIIIQASDGRWQSESLHNNKIGSFFHSYYKILRKKKISNHPCCVAW